MPSTSPSAIPTAPLLLSSLYVLFVLLACSCCHPCLFFLSSLRTRGSRPFSFSFIQNSKDTGSSIKDVKDDRGAGRPCLFLLSFLSFLFVILAHARIQAFSFSFIQNDKDSGFSMKDVENDREGESSLLVLSVLLVFSCCHPCAREDPGLFFFLHSKRQRLWILDERCRE